MKIWVPARDVISK